MLFIGRPPESGLERAQVAVDSALRPTCITLRLDVGCDLRAADLW